MSVAFTVKIFTCDIKALKKKKKKKKKKLSDSLLLLIKKHLLTNTSLLWPVRLVFFCFVLFCFFV